jgi:hypothetical protein
MALVEKLEEYYNENYTESRGTVKGQFVPSNLTHIDSGLKLAISGGYIDISGYFLDAGCGDGRIIALASGKYDLDSIGIECDHKLAKKAEKHISYLRKNKILNGIPVKIIKGDFTEESTYEEAGIDFKDIKTFYNYINNDHQIAEKIAKQSPKDTTLLVYTFAGHPESFPGLEVVQSFMLDDPCPNIKGLPEEWPGHDKIALLHIYKKV